MRYGTWVFFLVICTNLLRADEAPQFRGPDSRGISKETDLPVKWSEKENLRWQAKLPGMGLSSPVVAGGRAYVTACSGFQQKRLHVLCFDVKTGKQLWERQFWATATTLCHPKTNMAAPTPVTDGERVYALFATSDLACLDKDGNLEWYRSLVGDYPTVGNNVGMAASPILYKDLLVVCLDNAGESFLAGVDVKTGKNRWRVERPRGINWVSPIVIDNQGQDEVVVQSHADVTAYDAANGKKRWTLTGKRFGAYPSPTFGEKMVLAPGPKMVALAPGSPNQAAKVIWESAKLAAGYASPIVHDGKVYALSFNGVLNVASSKDGKPIWNQRLEGSFSACPLIADGKIFLVNEDGATSVIALGDKGELLATNNLPGKFLASPVASDSAIFLRTDQALFCISGKSGKGNPVP